MDTKHPYLSFRTFRRNGNAVDTPVWFASLDDQTHYLFSASDAGKVKRVKNSAQSEIATCDARGGSVGDWIRTEASIVTDAEEENRAYELLMAKYGWQMRITNFFSRLSGRINNRTVIRMVESG